MNKGRFTFELTDIHAPETVIRNAIGQISEATKDYVIGNIEKYTGEIFSYKTKSGLNAAFNIFQEKEVTVDIQKDLGEQSDEKNRYEVFLTVKGLEHYKYRIMFVDYGAIAYPVTIVMNETLAKEYNKGKSSYIYSVKTMKELEELLESVINSNCMIRLLQSLINEALRKELQE